jgi:crotonobetainyl-CoA:carnitine CoA-transferase CaiB-like acyl-CoA transferase
VVLERQGNRARYAAPQGLYPTAEDDAWLAVSVETDAQWERLAPVLRSGGGDPLVDDRTLDHHEGRLAAHDAIDDLIGRWSRARSVEHAVDELVAAGVPAALTRDPRLMARHDHLRDRGYYETVEHPVAGSLPIPTQPFRLTGVHRWTRRPAPVFGQHNDEILTELLGLAPADIEQLRADGVIADRPAGT